MVVFVLERVPVSLRGDLTRWLIELHAGVFVGSVNALVREKLWAQTCARMKDGAGLLIYSADNEQGFVVCSCGNTSRTIEDFEGLFLTRSP